MRRTGTSSGSYKLIVARVRRNGGSRGPRNAFLGRGAFGAEGAFGPLVPLTTACGSAVGCDAFGVEGACVGTIASLVPLTNACGSAVGCDAFGVEGAPSGTKASLVPLTNNASGSVSVDCSERRRTRGPRAPRERAAVCSDAFGEGAPLRTIGALLAFTNA